MTFAAQRHVLQRRVAERRHQPPHDRARRFVGALRFRVHGGTGSGIDQDRGQDTAGIPRSQLDGHPSAHGMTQEYRPLDTQRVERAHRQCGHTGEGAILGR